MYVCVCVCVCTRVLLPDKEPNGRVGSTKNVDGDSRKFEGDNKVVLLTVMSTRGTCVIDGGQGKGVG